MPAINPRRAVRIDRGTLVRTASPRVGVTGLQAAGYPAIRISEAHIDHLFEAAYSALPLLPEEVRQRVAKLLTRGAMAIIAGVSKAWAGTRFFGIGEKIDVVCSGSPFVSVGWDALQALRGFQRYYERAVHTTQDHDLAEAAREFASAILNITGVVGWGRLAKWLCGGIRRASVAEDPAEQLARWKRFIDSLEFKVPRNQGMLWSKLGAGADAEKLARQKGLVCLEMELRKNGFFELYEQEFGAAKNGCTSDIWKMASQRYVRSLEGRVTGYVHRAKHFAHLNEEAENAVRAAGKDSQALHEFKQQINPRDPVLVAEVQEITKILLSNPRITELLLVDVVSGEAFGYRTREVLESLQRLEQHSPP